MMFVHHARQQMGAAAGLRNGLGESAPAPADEYQIAKNRILRSHLPSRLRLSDPERSTLAEIGKRFGRRELQQGIRKCVRLERTSRLGDSVAQGSPAYAEQGFARLSNRGWIGFSSPRAT
jgi:hypothetical protein